MFVINCYGNRTSTKSNNNNHKNNKLPGILTVRKNFAKAFRSVSFNFYGHS